MALAPGMRLGSYEVIAQIGTGGMGEVYRATDTNLGRHVAIKILPDAFAHDPDRLARFEREAKTLAALNHPNIAQIYGLERTDGIRALVMELVEGPTLADRIAQGPIPIDEALPIAGQIVEALEAAHEQGIIHRDLKPANVKVRPDGTVKVLDFGLAKALDSAPAAIGASRSPTITSPAMMTGVGVLLGTAAYMSPEQARGKAVDKRSDIWAFGCVLYEMLAGRRVFDGAEVTDVLARVIERQPDFLALPAATPPTIHKLLRRCLEKDRNRRLPDIGVARLDIEEAVTAQPTDVPPPTTPEARSVGWRRAAALSVGFAATAVVAGAAVWIAMRPGPPPVVRTEVTVPGHQALNLAGPGRDLVVTPDGSRIVYRGIGQIFVRAVDQLDPMPLSGLGNPYGLFVSPDGQWVGFSDGGALKKISITGGPALTVCDVVGNVRGATWGEDGTIIFAATPATTGLERVSAAGGAPMVLTKPNRDAGEGDHVWPEFLPGGHAVLFTITPSIGTDNTQIAVLDLRNGTQKVLVRGGTHARYVQSGHLVYRVGDGLHAVAFDLDRLEVTGTAVPVVPQLVAKGGGTANFDVAKNGTLVYVPVSALAVSARRTLVWVDRQGREEPLKAPERAYLYPRLSPDGTRVAIAVRDQQNDIWAWDLARDTLTRITIEPGAESYPVWTPNGRRIIFGSNGGGAGAEVNLFWQAADGTGTAERLTESSNNQQPFSISPDGSRVIFREGVPPYDLRVLLLDKGRRTEPLTRTPFNELNAEVSPDGRWLAYESDESGQPEVYVRPFPEVAGGRSQVSNAGGTRPMWARNGQELFYVALTGDDDATLMSVRVQDGPSWNASTPTKLFAGRFFFEDALGQTGQGRTYDVAADGRRFLMIKEGRNDTLAASASIIVVQNFTEELTRLVR